MKKTRIKTIGNLHFISQRSAYDIFNYGLMDFKIGTCTGLWGQTRDSYFILSVDNKKPGNGHFNIVLQWFEYYCKRDNKNLLILQCVNKPFYKHLIKKCGFEKLDRQRCNCIKIFNIRAFRSMRAKGNRILHPKTFNFK